MKEKILITVKTYPTLSRKYAELVCTAGVTPIGEWRRLYPVRFRQLYEGQKYKKYQWVEADIEKSTDDDRPESYKIVGDSLLTIGEPLPTKSNWHARRLSFLNKVNVYDNLTTLIDHAHLNEVSLALFRPTKFLKFTCEEVAREWDPTKLEDLENQKRQLDLFQDEETVTKQLEVVRKLPYKFSYQFEDCDSKRSKLMIEDWEIGALYWNCLDRANGNEEIAIHNVQQKYWTDFIVSGRYDPVLILGTTLEHHRKRAPNPFVIIGLFYPPIEPQGNLF